MLRSAAVLLLSLTTLSCAQEKKAENQAEKKRLQSVTWDLKTHKLVWVVETGAEQNGKFVAKSTNRYEISPDDAVMAFSDEKRAFTEEEATSLHKLLDTLSLYCAESVVWWDKGQGEKVDGDAPKERQKVEHGDPERPKAPTKPGRLVARAGQNR
jgi:hypothetical protein